MARAESRVLNMPLARIMKGQEQHVVLLELRTLRALTAFKNTPNSKFVQNCLDNCFSGFQSLQNSMPNMTGRPGYWTREMNGGSSAPHLACTPCVPLFVHCLTRVEAEGLLDYQGRAGIISTVRWDLRPVIFGVEKQ